MAPKVVEELSRVSNVRAVDGTEIECRGRSDVEMVVRGTRLRLGAIVIDHVVTGLDAIIRLGGVAVKEASLTFSDARALCAMSLDRRMVRATK